MATSERSQNELKTKDSYTILPFLTVPYTTQVSFYKCYKVITDYLSRQ